ncbi:CMGC/SRPK protein kinase [Venturia nashicola]|uniref:CMGC/SRPK protein kinase n=1 Tax=Venturia nashicola TaxID=86259 RepID=A0A4Z1PHM6_9PEZI|nr:CMGC/SRPK protein kinase [Venturia nashicola]
MIYDKGLFYPMHIGDVLVHRCLVLDKLGFGISSTVWLVLDVHKNRYFALKATSTECINSREEEILDRLGDDEPDHPGWGCTSQLVDTFCVTSPLGKKYGSHEFLVFNLMAESLHSLAKYFPCGSIPPKIMKNFLKQVLLALDHAHNARVVLTCSEKYCKVPNNPVDSGSLHRPNNNEDIMLRERENHGIDNEHTRQQNTWEFPSRSLRGLYLSQDPTEDEFLGLNVALCDWGLARFTDKQHIDAVAPPKFKSPEMTIGAPWDEKSDIWTLGTQIICLMTGSDPFWGEDGKGHYSELQHLHEMRLNFGSFPSSLLDRGHPGSVNAHFNYGGEVQFRKDLVNVPRLEEWFETFDDAKEKEDFINLLRHMMRIDPEERSSTAEILGEPWLRDVILDHEIPKAAQSPLETGTVQERVDSVIDAESVRDSDSEHDSNSSSMPSEMDADLVEPPMPLGAGITIEPSTTLEAETTTSETTLLLIGAAIMMTCPVESFIFLGLGVAVHTLFKTLEEI